MPRSFEARAGTTLYRTGPFFFVAEIPESLGWWTCGVVSHATTGFHGGCGLNARFHVAASFLVTTMLR